MVNSPKLQLLLHELGLSKDQATIYQALLYGPKNHLEISRKTSIARSNVYRFVDELIEKGILHEITNEKGKLIEAADPKNLEVLVFRQEEIAKSQRARLGELLSTITDLKSIAQTFSIKTYSGISGLKQMLWNELAAKGEICIFSCGTLDVATGKTWAEKYRAEIISRNIIQRALENSTANETISSHSDYVGSHFIVRKISSTILAIKPEITIHDDIISIYNSMAHDIRLGTEIKNQFLAEFMKQIFEHFWKLAKK